MTSQASRWPESQKPSCPSSAIIGFALHLKERKDVKHIMRFDASNQSRSFICQSENLWLCHRYACFFLKPVSGTCAFCFIVVEDIDLQQLIAGCKPERGLHRYHDHLCGCFTCGESGFLQGFMSQGPSSHGTEASRVCLKLSLSSCLVGQLNPGLNPF